MRGPTQFIGELDPQHLANTIHFVRRPALLVLDSIELGLLRKGGDLHSDSILLELSKVLIQNREMVRVRPLQRRRRISDRGGEMAKLHSSAKGAGAIADLVIAT